MAGAVTILLMHSHSRLGRVQPGAKRQRAASQRGAVVIWWCGNGEEEGVKEGREWRGGLSGLRVRGLRLCVPGPSHGGRQAGLVGG